MSDLTIRTRYLNGDRWNSNVGGVRASGAGRTVTRRWNPALSSEENHATTARVLAARVLAVSAVTLTDRTPVTAAPGRMTWDAAPEEVTADAVR